ncbi:extracellular solute-binding protein [Paenibacillus sp. LHD-117]|uniref:extracellular solute-binding protein n=1 Tax=Paenibacillus sp. LHD-117 TaxID=3071412 RepID=UPI0027E1400C|nr:extracellular solute-binding protein [Paenibacillus sp. LHD-117]MDQ6423129.1 extracellular solute-binding protein [Paenibacillus sp. LHD-117]
MKFKAGKRRGGLAGTAGATLRLAALLLVAAALAGCMRASLAPEIDGERTENGDVGKYAVELEYWHTYSDLEQEVFLAKVLPLFEKQYPHIRVNAVRKDYTDQFKDTLLFAVADNKQPDVMRMDIVWVPEFAKKEALAELSGMPGFKAIKDTFIGSLIQTNMYKGGYYGLPVNANTRAAIYNKTLLREAGLTEPPTTFEELEAAAERLRASKPEAYGIGVCCSNGWGMLPYFWTLGGELTDPQYTKASGYLNGEGSRAALSRMKDWLDRGIVSRSVLGEVPGTWDGILKGQLMMIDDAHWFHTVNATGPNKELLDDVVIGLFPGSGQAGGQGAAAADADGKAATGTSVIGGENLVLFEQSEHKQEAWEFIRWMTSEEPQRIMAETGLIPTIQGLENSVPNPIFKPYLEQLKRAKPRPPVPNWTAIDEEFARMVERIMAGELTVEAATDQAAVQIDGLLRD